MLERLMALTKEKGLEFGVKLTNTFPVDVAAKELPSEEMYMSGKSLYPLSMSVAMKLAKDFDGKLRHQYLATFSRSFVGQLESLIDGAWRIGFDDLAESTQNLLLSSIPAECEDSVRLEQFYVADFEKLLKAPYQNEYYVTRNQIAAYESHEIDDICDYLTVHEVLELPYTARSEYVLYRWNDVFGNAEKIRSMVDRLRFQVECFNEALPYEAGQSYGDRAASQVRVIYRIS